VKGKLLPMSMPIVLPMCVPAAVRGDRTPDQKRVLDIKVIVAT